MSKSKIDTSKLVTCLLYIVIGILLCAMRMGLMNILMTIVGALFVIYGIYDLILHNVTRGVIAILIGVVIIVCGWTITTYVLLVFGVLLAVKGIYDLVNIIRAKVKDTMAIVSACITIAIGIIMCIAPFAIGDVICIIVGVIFILNGVLTLFDKQIH